MSNLSRTKRGAILFGVLALLAVLGLVLYACGTGAPPTTQNPTTTSWPATWPDGSTILPPDGEGLPPYESYGSMPYEGESESYSHTANETEPAAGTPAAAPSCEILKGARTPGAKTFTGLAPLPAREIVIADPNNSQGLPLKKIAHAYGAAKNEIPHQISIDNQNFFDSKRYHAVAYDNMTKEKVLYLTFDCGYENGNTAKILDVLKEKRVPAAFFCTVDEMKSAPEIVARMIAEGHIVGNHSVKHPSFCDIDRTRMAQEVLGADNYLRENFGYSAPFFRFPKGEYNESALDAVASMGFTSVFWSCSYSDWDTAQQKGAQHALDTVLARIHPGAVILLHSVSSDNAAAMAQIIDRAREMGYVFQDLINLPLFDALNR